MATQARRPSLASWGPQDPQLPPKWQGQLRSHSTGWLSPSGFQSHNLGGFNAPTRRYSIVNGNVVTWPSRHHPWGVQGLFFTSKLYLAGPLVCFSRGKK